MRVSEYAGGNPTTSLEPEASRPPASFVAAKIVGSVNAANVPLVYVALNEGSALQIADAARCLAPQLEIILLPPWDCLPYDRVLPSRQYMGRRMDALRDWLSASARPRLLVTSLDAILQRIPPIDVIKRSWLEVSVGNVFDRDGFERFVRSTGYIEDGLVDEPGEFAFRDGVIDIFPAGQNAPMRIVLTDDGSVGELKSYDPATQLTNYLLEAMVFGPASEAIAEVGEGENDVAPPMPTERGMLELYGEMPDVFVAFGDANILFAAGAEQRANTYLEFIDEARQAHRNDAGSRRSLYLDQTRWSELMRARASLQVDLEGGAALPDFVQKPNPRKAFAEFVDAELGIGRTVVLTGEGRLFDGLCRRVNRDKEICSIEDWSVVERAEARSLLRMSCGLEHGFIDLDISVVVITVSDVIGDSAQQSGASQFLTEPELQIGDVVVHEDYGIGILRGLETIDIDSVIHDAARLEYHGGASILVPMQELGKLWRYGSEPHAIVFDRLHTDAWMKKREAVTKDVRVAARHLLRLAKERTAATAPSFVPPRPDFSKFVTRFPYQLTSDQRSAISAVLEDLGSGKVMNRLICGDVGFGKTEVALRATAAVALSGGQVAVVVPTTVLARQHFLSFERRFAGSRIKVAMLSRVVEPGEIKRIKAGLASGDIHVVVATSAVLAKDVAFMGLGLMVIDEEHRFGAKDKLALKNLAPLLHTLTMSATPIPRTLQAAMVGVQDVSLLTTPPSKRRTVRTSLGVFDRPSLRVALLREKRRGGQSFLVAPQIDDLHRLKGVLDDLVPELTVQVAHGKMPSAAMDQIMVDFADGEGDVLLSTNIIESGLDVPRANTMFVWRADRFGLAQLHQLRGRVGRGERQGNAYLLTNEGDEISDETRLRLSAMVENDRLGAGLAISMHDLDLRGGGDLTGETQAGHMKIIGISLYQRLLEQAVLNAKKEKRSAAANVAVNLGETGTIPEDYVTDATVRLNLYSRLLRASSSSEIDALGEEFEDRFGDMPEEVDLLLRVERLKIAALKLGIGKLDAGPRGLAVIFESKPSRSIAKLLSAPQGARVLHDRFVYPVVFQGTNERMEFFEQLLGNFGGRSQAASSLSASTPPQ